MRAMVLSAAGQALRLEQRPMPQPDPGELRLRVLACAVCCTDLHIVDGDLPLPVLPIVPDHEIVGVVEALGAGVQAHRVGERVGVPWLGHSCGHFAFCAGGSENLCDAPRLTGYHRDGGFATHVVAAAGLTKCSPTCGPAGCRGRGAGALSADRQVHGLTKVKVARAAGSDDRQRPSVPPMSLP